MNGSMSEVQVGGSLRRKGLNDSQAAKAKDFHQFLLEYSQDEPQKELRTLYRQAADFFREKAFGKSDRAIRSAIMEVFHEYFDGENYIGIEIDNLAELTRIKAEVLQPVLEKMIAKGEVVVGKRRRYQEFGEHYNQIFKLKVRS